MLRSSRRFLSPQVAQLAATSISYVPPPPTMRGRGGRGRGCVTSGRGGSSPETAMPATRFNMFSRGSGGIDQDVASSRGRGRFDQDVASSRGRGGFDQDVASSRGRGRFTEDIASSRGRGGFDQDVVTSCLGDLSDEMVLISDIHADREVKEDLTVSANVDQQAFACHGVAPVVGPGGACPLLATRGRGVGICSSRGRGANTPSAKPDECE